MLAGWLRITPRSATEVADALEEHGWITPYGRPHGPTGHHGGPHRVRAGLLLRRIEDVRGEAAERVLDVLGERDRRTLDRILTRLGEQA